MCSGSNWVNKAEMWTWPGSPARWRSDFFSSSRYRSLANFSASLWLVVRKVSRWRLPPTDT